MFTKVYLSEALLLFRTVIESAILVTLVNKEILMIVLYVKCRRVKDRIGQLSSGDSTLTCKFTVGNLSDLFEQLPCNTVLRRLEK